jgi:hypothetical protein
VYHNATSAVLSIIFDIAYGTQQVRYILLPKGYKVYKVYKLYMLWYFLAQRHLSGHRTRIKQQTHTYTHTHVAIPAGAWTCQRRLHFWG